LALEEGALGTAAVDLARLRNHDGAVFEVVVEHYAAHAVVLEARLDHAFLEVAVEAQDLFVQLREGGLELFSNVAAIVQVVRELCVAHAFVFVSFFWQLVTFYWSGQLVQRDDDIAGISYLF
jgi:hypothetical protein